MAKKMVRKKPMSRLPCRLELRVSVEMEEALKKLADEKQYSVSQFVRDALREYVEAKIKILEVA